MIAMKCVRHMVVFKINIKIHKSILRGAKIKLIFPFGWQKTTQNITLKIISSLQRRIELQFPLPQLNALQVAIGLLVEPWDDHGYEIKKIESEKRKPRCTEKNQRNIQYNPTRVKQAKGRDLKGLIPIQERKWKNRVGTNTNTKKKMKRTE